MERQQQQQQQHEEGVEEKEKRNHPMTSQPRTKKAGKRSADAITDTSVVENVEIKTESATAAAALMRQRKKKRPKESRIKDTPTPPINNGRSSLLSTSSSLAPLPQPPDLPKLPPSLANNNNNNNNNSPIMEISRTCEWDINAETRVVRVHFPRCTTESSSSDGASYNSRCCLPFNEDKDMDRDEHQFLLSLYERDDVTIMGKGLFRDWDQERWTLRAVQGVLCDEFVHNFQYFSNESCSESSLKKIITKKVDDTTTTEESDDDGSSKIEKKKKEEEEEDLPMRFSQFIQYLKLRRHHHHCQVTTTTTSQKQQQQQQQEEENSFFTYTDQKQQDHTVDVKTDILALVNMDMIRLLPHLEKDFRFSFGLSGMLPGGKYCMMNSVNVLGRPGMGPYLSVSPPGPMTPLHQDGHGTMDTGMICIGGYLEVVMLRRLPEQHKQHALELLYGPHNKFRNLYEKKDEESSSSSSVQDDTQTLKWPTQQVVQQWKDMGYCPSVFIVKPLEYLHINKGRLYATRILSPETLPSDDCHAELRKQQLVDNTRISSDTLCTTVSWHWMFRGISTKGIHREVVSTLKCAELNHRHEQSSVAPPETCLLQMARTLAPTLENLTSSQRMPMFGGDAPNASSASSSRQQQRQEGKKDHHRNDQSPSFVTASDLTVLKGILPGLTYVIRKHVEEWEELESPLGEGRTLKPNTWENPLKFPLDPYSFDSFCCKLCHKELSNRYYHCDGCERLLDQDLNICRSCYEMERYIKFVVMNPHDHGILSTAHHTGQMTERSKRACLKNLGGKICKLCKHCSCCSCTCHKKFIPHIRFFTRKQEWELLKRVEYAVQNNDDGDEEYNSDKLVQEVEELLQEATN